MSLPSKMHAWTVKLGQREPTRSQIPVPKPGPNGLLVKTKAMGMCHSDCTILAMDGAPPAMNWGSDFVLGHEGAGEVVQLGDQVSSKDFSIGDRVAIFIVDSCGTCGECSRGLSNLCRSKDSGNYGLGRDGFFAEYVAVKAKAALKLPEGVDYAQGSVSGDAVLTAYHAVKYTAEVKPDQTVVIFGLGGVGLNGLQTALHLGVKRVLVVDKRQDCLDAAIKMGVAPEDTFGVGAKSIHEAVAEKGILVDTAIDFVGAEATILSAQLSLRPGGLLVMVGLFAAQVPVFPLVMAMNGLTIRGSYNGDKKSFEECLELIAQGVLKPSIETGSVEDLPRLLKDLDEGKIKSRMVLLPDWKGQTS